MWVSILKPLSFPTLITHFSHIPLKLHLHPTHITLKIPLTPLRKYYKHEGKLTLDVGAFVRALEYASGVKAEVVGKPAPKFFQTALSDLGVMAEEVSRRRRRTRRRRI